MKRLACLLIVVAAVLNSGTWASAGLIRYESESQFTAAATDLTTDSFAGLDTSGAQGYSILGGTVSRPNFTITNPGSSFAVTTGFGTTNTMPNGGTCVIGNGNTQTDITFTPGRTAVGFDIFCLDNAAEVAGFVTVSDGTNSTTTPFTYVAAVPSATVPTYLGFVETTPGLTITRVSAADVSVGKGFAFANMSVGNAAVPEPASIMLLVTGLLGLMAYAWRKRK